jgi:biotin carboxylase
VITADNRPANPGHREADLAVDVSTVDVDGVLRVAQEQRVAGVLAYGSDIAAPTAARVAAKLGLPGNPVEAIDTLCQKDRYRRHLEQHSFVAPRSCAGSDLAWLEQAAQALRLPLVVKPIDVSGSRGVTKVGRTAELGAALAAAHASSRSGRVIVEEFFTKDGYQLTGDGFLANGRLVWRCYLNQHFDPRGMPWFPVGESAPAAFPPDLLRRIDAEVQRLVDSLGMQRGALNFDVLVGRDRRVLLLEVGPRCGGNAIPVLLEHATGFPLTAAVVQSALGIDVDPPAEAGLRPHASYNLVDMLNACLPAAAKEHAITLRLGPELTRRLVFDHVELRGRGVVPIDRRRGGGIGPFRAEELLIGWLLLAEPDADTLRVLVDRIDEHLQLEVH